MASYKDKERGTWYCSFYYTTWDGQRKHAKKRGFQTKKKADEWERSFLNSLQGNMDTIILKDFVNVYFRDKSGELKERSLRNKKYMIEAHILPYFADKKMADIKPSDIIIWQNEMRRKNYSPTYLRMIQNQMTALFTHASNIYNLAENPCKKVKKMGKSDSDKLDFWTEDEYNKFVSTIEKGSRYYLIFEILFWTGCRVGELLALDKQSIDFENHRIYITKTYYRIERRDIITEPKTEQSVRSIEVPEFLMQEIKEYVDRMYGLEDDDRLFPIVAEAIQHKLKRQCEISGVKRIRVHDIRHSHVAYLIHQGVDPLLIKERLGHKDIRITLNTYGHLYPNQQKQVADLINAKRSGDDKKVWNEAGSV